MSGAETALEAAILMVLRADAGVKEVLGDPVRVAELDSPKAAYPYLEIARHTSEPAGALDVEASEHRIDLVVVSRDLGGAEAKAAMAVIRAALAGATLEMTGWRCVLLVPVFADATRQRIGLWRALLRVKAIVEAV